MFDAETLSGTVTVEEPSLSRRAGFNLAPPFFRPLQRLLKFIFDARFSEAHKANDTPEMQSLVKQVMQTRWYDREYGPSPEDPAQYVNFLLAYGTSEQCLRAYQLGGKAVDQSFDQPNGELWSVSKYLIEEMRKVSLGELRHDVPIELEKIFIATLFGIRFDDHAFGNVDQFFKDRITFAISLYNLERKGSGFEHAASLPHLKAALSFCFFRAPPTQSSLSPLPKP